MRRNTPEDFWAHVDRSGECWLWTRTKDKDGYGRVRWSGVYIRTHRLAYELSSGPVPAGLMVLHHCDTPSCVRPDHLFVGTAHDNVRDMIRKGRSAQQKVSACPKGHSMAPENRGRNGGGTRCLPCAREADRLRYWRKRAEVSR